MRRWFLPDMPDVVGLLRDQAATTVAAIEALVAWAGGDAPPATPSARRSTRPRSRSCSTRS